MADMEVRHRVVQSASGVPIAVTEQGNGWPIVLVHGTSVDGSRWLPLMQRLSSRFRAVTFDRRGRGSSGDAAAYTLADEAEDLLAVVRSVGSPLTLVAHSYGALCALAALPYLPRPISLVLYEPPLSAEPRPVPDIATCLEQLVERGEREAAIELFFERHIQLPRPQLDAIRAQATWGSRVAAAHTLPREMRAACAFSLDAGALSGFSERVLLLEGSESPALVRQAVQLLSSLLPRADLVTQDRQHHLAMDTELQRFSDLIETLAISHRDELRAPAHEATSSGDLRRRIQ